MYGDLFVEAMKKYGILAIGIYRFRDGSASMAVPSSKRFIITNPPYEFLLMSTDLVFCLMHFDPNPPKVRHHTGGSKHKKKKKKKDKNKSKDKKGSVGGNGDPSDLEGEGSGENKVSGDPSTPSTTMC